MEWGLAAFLGPNCAETPAGSFPLTASEVNALATSAATFRVQLTSPSVAPRVETGDIALASVAAAGTATPASVGPRISLLEASFQCASGEVFT